jgi:hypothetical protein
VHRLVWYPIQYTERRENTVYVRDSPHITPISEPSRGMLCTNPSVWRILWVRIETYLGNLLRGPFRHLLRPDETAGEEVMIQPTVWEARGNDFRLRRARDREEADY